MSTLTSLSRLSRRYNAALFTIHYSEEISSSLNMDFDRINSEQKYAQIYI